MSLLSKSSSKCANYLLEIIKLGSISASSFQTAAFVNQKRSASGARSPSSLRWLKRQVKDPYVTAARKEGMPSRAKFKLEYIDNHFSSIKSRGIFHPNGQTVLELGASPGSWSIYASQQIGRKGTLVAVDLLDLEPETKLSLIQKHPAAFVWIQGDFRSNQVKTNILQHFRTLLQTKGDTTLQSTNLVDVVLSDMAANFTGDQLTDALRTMSLCEDALTFAVGNNMEQTGILKKGGSFLCKFFSCGNEHEKYLMDVAKSHFLQVDIVKPPSSRRESSEKYLLARQFR